MPRTCLISTPPSTRASTHLSLLDEEGILVGRNIDFKAPSIVNPAYQLVALHPEHYKPHGGVLVIYDPPTDGHKMYVASPDRLLREHPGNSTACCPIPPFSSSYRRHGARLNPLLVILNAALKFRKYNKTASFSRRPPLPGSVQDLIKQTLEFVDLIYWEPVPTPGGKGENPRVAVMQAKQSEHAKGNEQAIPSKFFSHGETLLEARRSYGEYLMSGRNLEFTLDDESLLEQLHHKDCEFMAEA